jgi:hypothetical protein
MRFNLTDDEIFLLLMAAFFTFAGALTLWLMLSFVGLLRLMI